MSRGVQAFKQTDVTKAIRAAQKAGLIVQRFEIDRAGKIMVLAGAAENRSEIESEKASG
jgi:hypothetical protein